MRKMAMIGALVASSFCAAATHQYTLRAELDDPLDGIGPILRQRRGKGGNVRRGKKAPRRHGAKLKPNRLTVSKRVRRKHRRAR